MPQPSRVLVTGATGFTGATGVTIGGVSATNLRIQSDSRITASTGSGSSGAASVAVSGPNGTSAPNKLFTYVAPGTILFTQILGQPTDHSATINVQANAAIDFYYQYGTAPGAYTGATGVFTAAADPNGAGSFIGQAVLNGSGNGLGP